MHLSDRVHVEAGGMEGLKTGKDGKRKIISVLGTAPWKIYVVGWAMKVSSTHSLTSALEAVVCDHFRDLSVSWTGSSTL
jgi:hypothetical protein